MPFVVLGFCVAYAVLRYHIFGTVAPANFPCYVLNKAVSFSSVLSLCIAAYCARASRSTAQRKWFDFFKMTLFVHLSLSFFLLSPDYYPQMYANGKLRLFGELFMLFGVIALLLLMMRNLVKEFPVRLEILQALSLVAIALHNLFLGVERWPAWRDWPGFMPPITMLSFIATLTALAFQVFPRRAKPQS